MDSFNSSNNSNESFETKIDKLLIEQRLNGLIEKVEEKNQMIQQLFNINERLSIRIATYETEMKSSRPQPKIENLKDQLQQANNSLKELQNQISQGELENFELEESRITLQEKIEQQLSQHKKILNEYTLIFQQKISKLEKEKTDLQEIIEEKNQIITRSQTKHGKATAHLKNRKLEINRLKSDVAEKNEMIQTLRDQIAELKEENDRLQQNNGNLPENDYDFEPADFESSDDDDEGIESDTESNEGIRWAKNIRPQPIHVNSRDIYVVTEYFGYQKTATSTELIVFDWKDPSKCYRYGTYANKQSFCLGCSKANNGSSTLKIFDDENGKKYVQMKKSHTCKPVQYKEFSIERKTNFEIHSTAAGQKELVIFTSAERNECHRYHNFVHERFSCTACKHLEKNTTAELYQTENYVETDWPHQCQPSEYFENVTKPNFAKSEIKGKQIYPYLIIFEKNENVLDQTKCHVFLKNYNRYQCREKNCRITARIWEKDGNEYVQLYDRHVCEPYPVMQDENGKEYVQLTINQRSYFMSEN